MKNISFGQSRFVEFVINGDSERVIRIDPADYGIVQRVQDAKSALSALDFGEDAAQNLIAADRAVREQIDRIFAAPVSDVVFGVANTLTPVDGDGTMLFEAFLQAIVPEIEAAIKDRQGKVSDRIKAYTAPYEKQE